MESKKVADNPILVENETYRAVRNNEKIWLFHEKCGLNFKKNVAFKQGFLSDEDQPDYRYGHRVLSGGSSVISFDTNENQWSNEFFESKAFLSKDETRKLDEFIFAFAGSIFLLLVNRFEGLRLDSLWKFDEQSKEWTKQSDINKVIEQPTGDNTYGSKLLIVQGEQPTAGPYIVAKVVTSERTRFLLLQLKVESSEAEVLAEIEDLFSVLPAMDPLPFAAICAKQKIYIENAERGCGYRWRTEDLLRFDLETKQLDVVQVGHENPSFGLLMASENYYDSESDSWIFFGSLSKIGGFPLPSGEQPKPETQFYAISDLTTNPTWKQSDLVFVDPGRDDLYVPVKDSVYVVSRQHGTLKLPFGTFHPIKSRKEEL